MARKPAVAARAPTARAYDRLIVYGATGFTGRLVAEHLLASRAGRRYQCAGRWPVVAGKLAEVRGLIGAPDTVPLAVANADDPASLATRKAPR